MLIDMINTAIVAAGDVTPVPWSTLPTIPSGDLLSTATPPAESLIDFVENIADIVLDILHYVSWIITFGSLLSWLSPPPLENDDPDNSISGRIRKTFLYRWYKKFIEICGANLGWAKTFASRRTIDLVHKAVLGATSADALRDFVDEAGTMITEHSDDKENEDKVDKA